MITTKDVQKVTIKKLKDNAQLPERQYVNSGIYRICSPGDYINLNPGVNILDTFLYINIPSKLIFNIKNPSDLSLQKRNLLIMNDVFTGGYLKIAILSFNNTVISLEPIALIAELTLSTIIQRDYIEL